MQRNFRRGLLICLIPCVLAAYFVVLGKYRLGIDLAGGTILVYEINLERTKQRKEAQGDQQPAGRRSSASSPAEGLSTDEMQQLAAQIKRRIDPADLKNVTVRPLGDSRVEIILPTGGAGASGRANLSAEEIEEVKQLISQMGVLDFRILANPADDGPGIDAARSAIEGSPDALDARAAKGLPPEAPVEEFNVRVNEVNAKVRYVWVELDKEERTSLHINNANEGKSPLWAQLAQNRNKTVVHSYPAGDREDKVASMLLFSRVTSPTSPDAIKEVLQAKKLVKEGKLPESLIQNKTDTEIYRAIQDDPEAARQIGPKKYDYFVLTRVSPLDQVKIGGDVTLTASSDQDRHFNPAIGFRLGGSGVQLFRDMTERNRPSGQVMRNLAVVLDEKVISAPTLNQALPGSGQISSPRGLELKYVNRIVTMLRSGALSAELREKPVSENTIGPTLGADTVKRGVWAVGLAFAVVLVFMVIYYQFAGFVACVALLANLLLTIGFMVAVHAAFTLPGLAGIVLMLGMAVDANVLIYERLREERDKGANLATAIRNGYDRAFWVIIDTHLTSIFTAIVLYTLGNDNLKGFAISLTVGLAISLFTSLYMTRLLFDYWQHRRWLDRLRMLRLFSRPNLNPMKYRYVFFPITAALTIAGLGLFLYRGEQGLNVDFRGGTVFGGKLKDGEERALTTTGGKPGFRELLDRDNQDTRLNAVEARWVNRPASGDPAAVNTYVYEIRYGTDPRDTATVTLTHKPEGADEAAMAKDVLARARHLPDVSVEQVFLSDEPDYGESRSRYFTVRTTEKQKELVQVSLDRLLRDDSGKSLIAGATMSYPEPTGPTVELRFSKPTSPSYTRDLIQRTFINPKHGAAEAATTFELTGVGEAKDGRFEVMRLDVSKSTDFERLKGPPPADPEGQKARASQLQTLKEVLADTKQMFETFPEPERLEVFDSTLAAETRTKASVAILVSWVAIILYLWFRFGNWTFGLAAVLCLVHDLCFTLGAIAVCHYLAAVPGTKFLGIEDFKIDLAAVAALLTLVGYSVNEIIVNFARIREVRGKNPTLTPQMINDSVNQTLSRTILTSMTVLLVSIVLYAFGGEGVHLFAFVMVMGVMVSTYSSIFVASPLLLFLGEGHGPTDATIVTDAPKPEEPAEVEA
jgi:SecD/SecF fusion protein